MKKLNKEQIQQIYNLAEDNFSDPEIAMITGIGQSAVQARTSRYWREKMLAAHPLTDEEVSALSLFKELLRAFKENSTAFTLNKKDVTNLVDQCEAYIKTQ